MWLTERLAESVEPIRKKRIRRIHPMIFEEMLHMMGGSTDPVMILMAASSVKDDIPWLYELLMEVYRAAKSGDSMLIEQEIIRLRKWSDFIAHGPFMEEFGGLSGRDSQIFLMEFPRMLERMLHQLVGNQKPRGRKRTQASL
jgi:hypothetical protein